MKRIAGIGLALTVALVVLLFTLWGALALWFRFPAGDLVRAGAAALFGLVGLATAAALFTRARWPAIASFAVVFFGLTLWWTTITPPESGNWATDVARQTTGQVDGDILTLSDVRDFDWRTEADDTERWGAQSYDLSRLKGLDLFLAYWAGPEMAHLIMSFEFEDGRFLAWSIEVRREKGGQFSPVADAFRNSTLVYLATTERDSIRLRANIRKEDVRLYRLNTPPDQARLLLLEYVAEANALAEHPRFYNSITANCATSVVKLARAAGARISFDWRLIANGFAPGWLYDRGVVDTSMPLAELMERAKISPRAIAAGDSPDFSRLIRVGVPLPPGR